MCVVIGLVTATVPPGGLTGGTVNSQTSLADSIAENGSTEFAGKVIRTVVYNMPFLARQT